eukprot:TRINITY_DN547_c0_g1_i4.p1 TRINITY_DN547_c0_g1~~TRINITY_DN547_c0_g1_i4.p1  ORF type:complete len:692 (+),score=110.61 TRINITY_DN547_c0_g1_i4:247-2076(+)
MDSHGRGHGVPVLPGFVVFAALLVIFASSISMTMGSPAGGRSLLGAKDHSYRDRDAVPLYANKIGPFHNPSETYHYYDLPFCQPSGKKKYKPEDLGEVLEGDRMVNTMYELPFNIDKVEEKLCTFHLSRSEVAKFRRAVRDDYYFQMFYDDLPVWGFVGRVDVTGVEPRYFLHTFFNFQVEYNKDRVIYIQVTPDKEKEVEITEDAAKEVTFKYAVKWIRSEASYETRMDKYAKYSFLPQHLEIHWFSIINSCVTVLLLTGFLATILMRVLKNDFIKYTREDEAAEDQDETGWKYIHGDVFRFPAHTNLFCSVIGSGTQLLAMVLCIFGLALIGVFYPYNRGALYTASIVLYALTSGINGYVSACNYKQMGGENWVRNVMLAASLYCGPFFAVFAFCNTVAIAYSSTAALPFGTIVIILIIWALVTFPLTVLGGIAGKNTKTEFYAPCRTNKFPREIPPLPWYRQTIPQMAMAGFLPFSAIYIELYYIFASVWGHKIYTIYSILFIVFIILIVVTAFITIALTYFQLAIEDHAWWWRSVFCGGSTAFFIFGYCFYYYLARSDMKGFMQTSFFFGYMACVCYGFFLMLGSVGYRASLLFVRHIYRAIKCE